MKRNDIFKPLKLREFHCYNYFLRHFKECNQQSMPLETNLKKFRNSEITCYS